MKQVKKNFLKERKVNGAVQEVLHVEDCFLLSNAVDGMHIFKRPCAFPFLPLYYFYAEFQNRITTV